MGLWIHMYFCSDTNIYVCIKVLYFSFSGNKHIYHHISLLLCPTNQWHTHQTRLEFHQSVWGKFFQSLSNKDEKLGCKVLSRNISKLKKQVQNCYFHGQILVCQISVEICHPNASQFDFISVENRICHYSFASHGCDFFAKLSKQPKNFRTISRKQTWLSFLQTTSRFEISLNPYSSNFRNQAAKDFFHH